MLKADQLDPAGGLLPDEPHTPPLQPAMHHAKSVESCRTLISSCCTANTDNESVSSLGGSPRSSVLDLPGLALSVSSGSLSSLASVASSKPASSPAEPRRSLLFSHTIIECDGEGAAPSPCAPAAGHRQRRGPLAVLGRLLRGLAGRVEPKGPGENDGTWLERFANVLTCFPFFVTGGFLLR